MIRPIARAVCVLALLGVPALGADEPVVKITDVSLKGTIEGENITFELALTAEPEHRHPEFALISGDLVLEKVVNAGGKHEIRYDERARTYFISWRWSSTRKISLVFACRPAVVDKAGWREATFRIPAANARELSVVCDRPDLEISFPGAVRFERELVDGVLTASALLGPGRPFSVRWKPQVQELESKLVMSSEANSIVTAGTGALRINTLFVFNVSQGKLRKMRFGVPDDLSVTQVRSPSLQDWVIETEGGKQILSVTLSREETRQHAVEVTSEVVLGDLPTEAVLPVIEPLEVIRSSGQIALGTNSALRLLVTEPRGISQVDAGGFPRMILDRAHPRTLPRANAFYYTYAAVPYHMKLRIEDIVPSYDASERFVVTAREENMTIDADFELEIRDAPLRKLTVLVDEGLMVSEVEGAQVADYSVRDAGGWQEAEVQFAKPVMGRALISMKLELAELTLDVARSIGAISVKGAKSERGWIAVATEQGIELDAPEVKELREVHTDSMPMKVPGAQHAYRFREGNWTLSILARTKKPSARGEVFHLVSIGDGVAYGSVAVTYFVTGAPVDELQFRVPAALRNVEFVSRDVRRWSDDGERWTVHLQRKIIGDYNLLVTFNQEIGEDRAILAGGVRPVGMDTLTGFICVASKLNLEISQAAPPGDGLLEVDREEVPAAYRLQVNAPLLKAYKYVKEHDGVRLVARQYERGQLVHAVIEQTELETDINVNNEREAQSSTTVRYKVKNSRGQFLSLKMPEGVDVWSVHLIEGQGRNRTEKRVVVSRDVKERLLMIPLERRRNPNEPLTVQVEYASAHGKLPVGGQLALFAPRSQTHSTYTRWKVRVPHTYAVYANSKGMPADEEMSKAFGLPDLLSVIAAAWAYAFAEWTGAWITWFVAGWAVASLVIVWVFFRSAFKPLAITVAVVGSLALGLVASMRISKDVDAEQAWPTEASYVRTVDLDQSGPTWVGMNVVPSWRRHATVVGAILVPLVSLVLIVAAVFRRVGRVTLSCAGATGVLYGAAQFPAAWPVIAYALTWAVPVVAALVSYRFARSSAGAAGRSAAATAVLLLVALLAPTQAQAAEPGGAGHVESVSYVLKAEKDHVAIDVTIQVDQKEELEVPLMHGSAILMSPDEEKKVYEVINSRSGYVLKILRPRERTITLKFLAPLDKAGADRLRRFDLAIPPALRNSVTFTIAETNLEVVSPTAIKLVKEEKEGVTTARASFGPTDDCVFMWKPRARKASLEKTSFYVEVTSLARLGLGVAECRHRIRIQVAQGELKSFRCKMPKGMTVTAVDGADIGTWRFSPAEGELEAHLAKPATGQFEVVVLAQAPVDVVPYEVSIATPEVLEAVRQRGVIGIATTAAVYADVTGRPSRMNIEDFVRDAAGLAKTSGVAGADIRGAYRVLRVADAVSAKVHEVRPEIRTSEQATFSVGDDRLVYNGMLNIQVSKTGVFSLTLSLPKGYDVDSLVATGLSHWDDSEDGDNRLVQMHFGKKRLGTVDARLTLSKAIAEVPREIVMPRVQVVDSIKHTGMLKVSSDRGVRLSVGQRKSVSEMNPLEAGIRQQGVLAFRLLSTDWDLKLKTEVVETRTVVDFLHVAKISEGLVRHTDYLNFRVFNAGSRIFEVRVPEGALGVEITGPEIANVREAEPGLWRVELARKWFGHSRPYRLTVRYESRFDQAGGEVALVSARAIGVDLQRGFVAAYATEKVEITPVERGSELQRADARSITRTFGAGDLSGAAYCFTSSTPEYALSFRAVRHEAARLLQARVQNVRVSTVVAESGDSINRVVVNLLVGGKRYLETILPEGAEIWSLLTDGRTSVPSHREEEGRQVLMLPLGQAASNEMAVRVEFVYVCAAPDGWSRGKPEFVGPHFDLPLKDMEWDLYLPKGFEYDDFEGSMVVDTRTLVRSNVVRYQSETYDRRLRQQIDNDNRMAETFLKKGNEFASQGKQMEAKQALENAFNLSLNKQDLNEDARVQLHKLNRQQAVVGLVGRRNRLRPGAMKAQAAPQPEPAANMFDQQQAERIESSLGKNDSENLQLIADRMIGQQRAAAGFVWPLKIDIAPRGRHVTLRGSIQVKPAPVKVDFRARRLRTSDFSGIVAGVALFGVLLGCSALVRYALRRAGR